LFVQDARPVNSHEFILGEPCSSSKEFVFVRNTTLWPSAKVSIAESGSVANIYSRGQPKPTSLLPGGEFFFGLKLTTESNSQPSKTPKNGLSLIFPPVLRGGQIFGQNLHILQELPASLSIAQVMLSSSVAVPRSVGQDLIEEFSYHVACIAFHHQIYSFQKP